MSDASKSVFSKLIEEPKRGRPEPEIPRGPLLRPEVPLADHKSSPLEQLLSFLVHRWPKSEIRLRDICRRGPGSIRDRKSALSVAETLAAHGWLSPKKSRRYDTREWKIVRGPNE
jgi:hypothetical protein